MLQSSTPDGLAPLTPTGVLIFVIIACTIYILYGILSMLLLLRVRSQGESAQKFERVFEMTHKIFIGSLGLFKFDVLIGLTSTLIFFMIIMGAVEHFQNFSFCLAYLFGALNSLICGFAAVLISKLMYARILTSARYSLHDAYSTSKNASNFLTFFTTGWTIFIIALYLIFYQMQNPGQQKKVQFIEKVAKTLISFCFGSSTVAIGCKICHSIYSKSADVSMQTLNLYENRLQRNHRHPALICKAVGEHMNKFMSSILDNIMYMTACISCGVYAAATNVIGTDQNGQIIFQLDYNNIYLPLMSVIFSMLFLWFFNITINKVMIPQSEDGIRKNFNIQRYGVIVLLCGFQALVSYISLPAQFFIKEIGDSLRHPYHAYLCILFGIVLTFLITFGAQIMTTHPFFVNIISNSCKTGSATNIIYGLSFGYMFNFIPLIFITGIGFLSNYWLGTYGVGLVAIGVISSLPLYTNFSLIYSAIDNSSYISYICGLQQTVITTLITGSKTRKDFQPHLQTIYYIIIIFLGYQTMLEFINLAYMNTGISLNSPYIFAGLIVGAFYPYVFSSSMLRSVHRTAPAIAYDLRMQVEQIPSMGQGSIDPDFIRTNSLFSFQCGLSIKRFLPILFLPFVGLGIGLGPIIILGFMIGSTISGVQLGLANGISGAIWSVVKKQIGFNSLRDEQMNIIKSDSQWGRAAQVGSQIGQPLKDCVNAGIHNLLTYSCLLQCMMATVYKSIHS